MMTTNDLLNMPRTDQVPAAGEGIGRPTASDVVVGPRGPALISDSVARPRSKPISERMRELAVQASVVASATSVLLHVALVALAAVVTIGLVSTRPTQRSAEGELILALAPETELAEFGDADLDAAAPTVTGPSDLPELVTSGVLEGAGGDDSPASGSGFGAIGEGLGGAGGGDIGEGKGLGSGGSGGGAASFFGVEAKGSRFAYVLDVSGSMTGDKLRALKIELAESINALQEHMSFYIVLYSSESTELGGRSKWTLATPAGKRWAVEAVHQLSASGGTVPWSGFERVFAIKPSPDAAYFMTDGIFDPSVADLIALRNKGSKKVPINCISFVDRSAEELMRQIAAASGGSYVHIEGPR